MLRKQLSIRRLLDQPSLIEPGPLRQFCQELKALEDASEQNSVFHWLQRSYHKRDSQPVYSLITGKATFGYPNGKQRPHYFSINALNWLKSTECESHYFPDFCYDSIGGELFKDPWIDVFGHTYEINQLEKWKLKKKTAPLTNQNYLSTDPDPWLYEDRFARQFIALLHEAGVKKVLDSDNHKTNIVTSHKKENRKNRKQINHSISKTK